MSKDQHGADKEAMIKPGLGEPTEVEDKSHVEKGENQNKQITCKQVNQQRFKMGKYIK